MQGDILSLCVGILSYIINRYWTVSLRYLKPRAKPLDYPALSVCLRLKPPRLTPYHLLNNALYVDYNCLVFKHLLDFGCFGVRLIYINFFCFNVLCCNTFLWYCSR